MLNGWTEQIREWGDHPTPENARNLIRAFRQCDSGVVRLEILSLLGRCSDPRSHRFLVDRVRSGKDLAERESAIRSIGRRGGPYSRRILLRFLDEVPASLESPVITALGQARAFSAVSRLSDRLKSSLLERNHPVLKSIVVALGELKGVSSLDSLRTLLDLDWVRTDRELALPILFAWGRLGRDPGFFESYGRFFREDPFSWQVFESALNQVQLRSQVRIEDYLHRVFHAPDPHPNLPLELRAFDPDEVAIGLSVFDREVHWRRHLFCLKALDAKAQNRFFSGWVIPESEREVFLRELAGLDEWADPASVLRELDTAMPGWCDAPDLRLARIAALPQAVDWLDEARRFAGEDEKRVIALLNHWSDWNLVLPDEDRVAVDGAWVALVRTAGAKARLCRSVAESGRGIPALDSVLVDWFTDPSIRDSALIYAEKTGSPLLLDGVMGLPVTERAVRLAGVMRYFESLLSLGPDERVSDAVKTILAETGTSGSVEVKLAALRVIQLIPLADEEARVISWVEDPDPQVRLNAVIALRGYVDSAVAVPVLIKNLEISWSAIRERALDALCVSRVPLARQRVLEFIARHANEEWVVERVYRELHPGFGDDRETARILKEILSADRSNPQSVKWEEVLGRFLPKAPEAHQTNSELEQIDSRLRSAIPRFDELDGTIQLALRAAEQPFLQSGLLEKLPIDKAPTVLQYCKALDLVLDRYLGQKRLFPRIDESLPDFQQVWHRLGFVEEYPLVDRVIYLTGLKGRITPEHFPLHKAKMMCGTFFNGRILQDRYKVFDGLRAWAVIFLLFARKIPGKDGGVGPLVGLKNADEADCVKVAVTLMSLQDLRNPAAHRQTYPDLDSVRTVREDSLALVNRILEWIL